MLKLILEESVTGDVWVMDLKSNKDFCIAYESEISLEDLQKLLDYINGLADEKT